MRETKTRRRFLAALGLATAPLAGCANSLAESNDDSNGTDTTRTTPTTTTAQTTESPSKEAPFQRGELIEDFENLDEWGTIVGSMHADTNSVYAGTQSVRVENSGDSAGIYRAFPDGLDLSKNDVSVAMQLEAPADGKLSVDFYAPGESNHALSRRYIPKDLNDWVRFDLGYVNEPGEPEMSNVQELRFVVHPRSEGGDVKFRLDDVRLLPKQVDNGKVMLTFDDNFESHTSVAYEELKKRGWQGVLATIPWEIGREGRQTIGDLRRMQDDGWDIASHPQLSNPPKPLPSMSKSEQRDLIEKTKHKLELKGFTEGPRIFVTPFDQLDGNTIEVVSDVHEMGFVFGACNNAVPPSGRYNISRVYGNSDDLHGAWRQIKLAARRNQMTVLAFHDIGPDGATSVKDFQWLLNTIEKLGLDVVTASDVLEMYD